MDNFIDNVGATVRNITANFEQLTDRLISNLGTLYIGLAFLVLVLVILVLIIAAIVRGHKYNEAMDLIDEQVDTILTIKREAKETVDRSLAKHAQREQQAADALYEKELLFAAKEDELLRLRQFYEKNRDLDSVKGEVQRLISEAESYADGLKVRAEREYGEIIGHAQSEATTIRDISQGMMTRSQQMLKNSMNRASEIIDEAKRQSTASFEKAVSARPRPAVADLDATIAETLDEVTEPVDAAPKASVQPDFMGDREDLFPLYGADRDGQE